MSAELEALKVAYETLGMTPEQIAEDRQLDITSVKAGLMQCSSRYRRDCGKEEEADDSLNFNDDDLQRVNQTIVELALGAENEAVRLKAAMYVRDDKKGRHDVVKQVGGMGFNILQFNQFMEKSRAGAEQIKQEILGVKPPKVINV